MLVLSLLGWSCLNSVVLLEAASFDTTAGWYLTALRTVCSWEGDDVDAAGAFVVSAVSYAT